MLADLIKLGPHKGVAVYRGKILPVHNLRHMMGCNGTPVGNSCRTVLISSGIAAVRISLGMADKDRHITVIHILIHKNRVSPVCRSQINHVFIILAVMADDLVGIPEFVEQLLPQDIADLLFRTSGMKAVGADQQDILFLPPQSTVLEGSA